MILIFIIILLVVVLYGVSTYNKLIKLRNKVREGFATMDVFLKKRWSLIPNVVETVKGYAKHEKETLEEIVNLRTGSYDSMSSDEKIKANNELSNSISKIMAIAEAYPDLKASDNFKDLSSQLSKVEDDIAASRKAYNEVVREYNNVVEVIPSKFVASLFGFALESMFEAVEVERKEVEVKF